MRTLERAKRGEFHQPDEDTVWLGFMVGGNEPSAPEIRCKSQILIEVTPAVSGSTEHNIKVTIVSSSLN